MDRRWRGQQGQNALQSLRSFYEYKDSLPATANDGAESGSNAGQDIVVPVSASYTRLTPAFLSSLLDLSPMDPPCVVLAIVDSDGTVVLNRLSRGIHAPAEGFTGTDTLGTGKRSRGGAKEGGRVSSTGGNIESVLGLGAAAVDAKACLCSRCCLSVSRALLAAFGSGYLWAHRLGFPNAKQTQKDTMASTGAAESTIQDLEHAKASPARPASELPLGRAMPHLPDPNSGLCHGQLPVPQRCQPQTHQMSESVRSQSLNLTLRRKKMHPPHPARKVLAEATRTFWVWVVWHQAGTEVTRDVGGQVDDLPRPLLLPECFVGQDGLEDTQH
ncbi:MAG: hypothetical protein FRX49_10136 [Trebouxia sp. A1-2]|nr:MAG: hypothetical protein FRX49_10136 [Trebouxia sp. A1-2]